MSIQWYVVVTLATICTVSVVALIGKAMLLAHRKRKVGQLAAAIETSYVHAKPKGSITFKFSCAGQDDVRKAFMETARSAKQLEETLTRAAASAAMGNSAQ